MKLRCCIPLTCVLLFFALLVGVPLRAQTPPDEPEVILLKADPEIIFADGQSTATITAEVRNRRGGVVPDGTTVYLTTTAGNVSPQATTRSGIARATLRSAPEEGVAEITATSGLRAIARFKVTFTSEKLPAQQMRPFVRVEAEGIQYLPEKSLVDAAGNVRLAYRSLLLTADSVQFNSETLQAKARGKVRLRSAGRELMADLLTLNLHQVAGQLVALEETGGIRRQTYMGYRLDTTDQSAGFPPGTFDFEEFEDPKAVMTARKLTLFPGDKMQFSNFGLHVGGTQVLGLRFYVLSLNPYAPDADQHLGVDSMGGISVNLPFYYSVTDDTSGSIRLRRQTRYSYDGYSTRPGWQLALDQRYNFGANNHGLVELNHITTKDWGLRWRHDQQFGSDTHAYVSADAPGHKDLYARTELYHSMPLGDLSLSSDASVLKDAPSSLYSRLYFRMRPFTIKGPNIRYYWSANVGYSRWGETSELERGVDLQVHPPSLRLGRTTSLQFYLGSGYTVSERGTGPTAQGSAAITRRIGRASSASLRYSYYYSGRTSDFYGSSSSQNVTGQLYAAGSRRWNASLTATLVPDSGSLSVYGGLAYMPWRDWRVELRPSYSRYGGGLGAYGRSNTNLDVYLARQIGGQDLALRWSTLDKRIRFEFATTALRF